jgi:hypothetical protein
MALINFFGCFKLTKAEIKLYNRIIYGGDIMPDKVAITPAKGADKTKIDNLIVQDTDTSLFKMLKYFRSLIFNRN